MTDERLGSLLDWLLDCEAVSADCEPQDLLKLGKLDLSSKGIEELHEDLGLLQSLYALNLADNRLVSLPQTFGMLHELKNLDLRQNRLELLPPELEQLEVRSLNLSSNAIRQLRYLPHTLLVLDISYNDLREVGIEIGALLGLRNLNLSNNHIHTVQSSIAQLENLEILNLRGNYLKAVPKGVIELQHLLRLDCAENMIVGMKGLDKIPVEFLDLSLNEIDEVVLEGLDDLEELLLDDNPVEVVRVDENFAPYLKMLSFENCNLSRFIELPSRYTCLENISFNGNHMTRLPEDIGKYGVLRELGLDNNAINVLPESFFATTSLKHLYIANNPLNKADAERIMAMHLEFCDLHQARNVEIRCAREEDLEEMARLLKELFDLERDFTFDFETHNRALRIMFEQEKTLLLVAKLENIVVGMATMQEVISTASGGKAGMVEDVIIHGDFRKMGIGSRILQELTKVAKERGYRRMQLVADRGNARALHFYSAKGWNTTNLQVMHFHHL